jgi:hypothetical protein
VLGAEPTPVADLTDFRWSTLTVIDEGTERSEARDLLGIEFFTDDRYFGVGLAVFCGDGEVAMVTYLNTEALGGHFPRTVSHDALLGSGSLSDPDAPVEPTPHCVGAE